MALIEAFSSRTASIQAIEVPLRRVARNISDRFSEVDLDLRLAQDAIQKNVTKNILYGCIISVIFTWLVIARLLRRKKPILGRERSPDPEKPAAAKRRPSNFKAPIRPVGVWPPSDFRRPKPMPLLDWDVHTTKPLPYRPFRYGPNYITMALRTMQWDEWIELDNHYLRYHAEKKRRIQEREEKCCRTAPEAMEGAIELLEEL